jgi:hypothetical protein
MQKILHREGVQVMAVRVGNRRRVRETTVVAASEASLFIFAR